MLHLRVENNYTYVLDGQDSLLRKWLRVKDESAIYTDAYKFGVSDGYEHFYDLKKRRFPSGLLRRVTDRAKKIGLDVKIDGGFPEYELDPVTDDFLLGVTLRDYQVDAINAALSQHRGFIQSPTGSGKTTIMAGVVGSLLFQKDIRSLVLVPKLGLLHQTKDEFQERLGTDVSVGMVGDGKRQVDADVVIATPQTLRFALPEKTETRGGRRKVVRKHEPRLLNLLRSRQCLLLDECQHISSRTWYELCQLSPAAFRIAFSGTPEKGKRWEDMRLWAVVGDQIFTLQTSDLIERGILAKTYVFFVTDESLYPKKVLSQQPMFAEVFGTCLRDNPAYNAAVAKITKALVDSGRPPLVLTPQVKHILRLGDAFDKEGVPYEVLYGKHSTSTRKDVKDRFMSGEIFAIVASVIMDEGEDVPNISSIVLAGGGKAKVAAKQRIGRGMRLKEDDNRLIVIDFAHLWPPMLARHSMERFSIFEEDGFPIGEIPSVEDFRVRDLLEVME